MGPSFFCAIMVLYSKEEELLHCLPPSNLLKALSFLRHYGDEESRRFTDMQHIPFVVVTPLSGKPFLACPFNTRNGRYRSPWDNSLHPRLEDDLRGEETDANTNQTLRGLEITLNEVWRAYATLYYGHESVSSAYLKPSGTGLFECLLGIQKVCAAGSWNSSNHVTVANPTDGDDCSCRYYVETTVQLVVQPETQRLTCSHQSCISAVVSKTIERSCKLPSTVPSMESHVENIGKIIEANEIDLRSNLEKVFITKNREAIDSLVTRKAPRNGVNRITEMMMNSEMLKRREAATRFSY